MKFKSLIVAGDPIVDIYITLKDGRTSELTKAPGGAANAYYNARNCLLNYDSDVTSNIIVLFYPHLQESEKYKLLRVNELPSALVSLCQPDLRSSYYNPLTYEKLLTISESVHPDSIFLFSDYNKGFINTTFQIPESQRKLKMAFVDSKNRTFNLNYLSFFKESVWRCTGDEYDKDYAKNFTYTIWTDGPNPIKLLNSSQEVFLTFEVPKTSAVDTCGAGDTFTAALASYVLLFGTGPTSICSAIAYAIECAQEVIAIKGTVSTTNILPLN